MFFFFTVRLKKLKFQWKYTFPMEINGLNPNIPLEKKILCSDELK